MEKLRSATEILMWVRETSVDPIGVPQLSNATEAAERAAAALRVAQDAIAAYLGTVGLTGDASAPPDGDWRPACSAARAAGRRGRGCTAAGTLGPWWQQRVTELTGEPPPESGEAGRDQADTASCCAGSRPGCGRRPGPGRPRPALGERVDRAGALRGHPGRCCTGSPATCSARAAAGRRVRLRTAAEGRVRSLLPGTSPAVLRP